MPIHWKKTDFILWNYVMDQRRNRAPIVRSIWFENNKERLDTEWEMYRLQNGIEEHEDD